MFQVESGAAASRLASVGGYFTKALAERRAPGDDLFSDMARLQAEGLQLNDEELRISLSALLVGGNLTTTDLISNGVQLLLTHPAELAKLLADRRAEPGSPGPHTKTTLPNADPNPVSPAPDGHPRPTVESCVAHPSERVLPQPASVALQATEAPSHPS